MNALRDQKANMKKASVRLWKSSCIILLYNSIQVAFR